MNEHKQRIKIAEACGYFDIHKCLNHLVGFHKDHDEGNTPTCIPEYLNDLNAMHEAEKTLNYTQSILYGRKLWYIVSQEEYSSINDIDNAKRLACATPEQRSEAFLKTLNLWAE